MPLNACVSKGHARGNGFAVVNLFLNAVWKKTSVRDCTLSRHMLPTAQSFEKAIAEVCSAPINSKSKSDAELQPIVT